MGTFASNVGLAVANLASQRKVLFLAAEPLTDKIVWENGNRYTFRLRPSTYMQTAMLIPEAAKLKKKRWAIVYPNYEYGQSATASFKKLLKQAQPDVEFVAEQAPPLGKIDAGAVVQALADAKPDAIFSSLFAADLQKFVREGNTRGLFKNIAGVQPPRRRARVPRSAARTRRRRAGGSPAIRGARSTRPSTAASATRTRSAGRTTRARARWSATPRCTRSPTAVRKARSADTEKLVAGAEGTRDADPVRPDRLARASTTSRPWAPTSASSRGRTARASW